MSRPTLIPTWAALGAILVAGLVARAAAFTGQSFSWGSDESRFIAVAQNLANGYFPKGDAEWFGGRIGLLWPVAATFRLLDPGDVSAAVWPLLGSLLAVVAAFLLGRDLGSRRVGFVAAALVALAPLEALVGTRIRPDAIMPGIAALAVWFALRAGRTGGRAALIAGLLLGLAWSVRENALLLAPVLVFAGWRAGRRALLAGLAGLAIVPAATAIIFAIGRGDPLGPLAAAGTEGEFRNPVTAFRWDDAYVTQIGRDFLDLGSPLFLLAPVAIGTILVLLYRRDGRAVLPAVWLAWAGIYLEFGTLVNLAKPTRYLTLCTIPLALLIALAADSRWLAVAVPAVVAACTVAALWSLPARDLRPDDVTLVARVADRLRGLPDAPVLAESYTWWAKLTTYTARTRLAVPDVQDPAFVSADEARTNRRLLPLPDPADYRGGYVVTGPVHPRPGWPSNWRDLRRRMRAEIPQRELVLVAAIGGARVWRWTR
jgi:4-amino-4-deoxy-L-arabinose transferase-like glycosyltransferase